MKRKLIFLALVAVVAMLALVGCRGDDNGDAPAADLGVDTGNVLRIAAWNDSFRERFEALGADLIPEGVSVEWVIVSTEGNAYQNWLDDNLPGNADSDNPIDIFLAEADYILRYVDSPFALDVIGDLGISRSSLDNMFQYTLDIATDSGGVLRGLSYEANPGVFIYRRSIAQAVFGNDDPDYVQSRLSNWNDFNAAARLMSENGFTMLSGFDDAYRVFANNTTIPWVVDDVIQIDPMLWQWVDQTMYFTENGFNHRTSLWSGEWARDMSPGSDVFGFFFAPWTVSFVLTGNSGGPDDNPTIYGDFAVIEGPAPFFWGGTWVIAAAGTDNPNLVRDVMYRMTIDRETAVQMTRQFYNMTNHYEGMAYLGNDPAFGLGLLGGQNMIAVFNRGAGGISMDNMSPYDQTMTEAWQDAFSDYFEGTVDRDAALENFFTRVLTVHPYLQRP